MVRSGLNREEYLQLCSSEHQTGSGPRVGGNVCAYSHSLYMIPSMVVVPMLQFTSMGDITPPLHTNTHCCEFVTFRYKAIRCFGLPFGTHRESATKPKRRGGAFCYRH
jgi:hypothetical protein